MSLCVYVCVRDVHVLSCSSLCLSINTRTKLNSTLLGVVSLRQKSESKAIGDTAFFFLHVCERRSGSDVLTA